MTSNAQRNVAHYANVMRIAMRSNEVIAGGCVWLEAADADRNITRSYGIWVSREMFGAVIVEAHWGRIGEKGQGRAVSFPGDEAVNRHVKAPLNRRATAPLRIGVSHQPCGTFFMTSARSPGLRVARSPSSGAMAAIVACVDGLSPYLRPARSPDTIVAAFASPHDLRIKHIAQIKPPLKPIGILAQVGARAGELARTKDSTKQMAAADNIKQLAAAAKGPQKVRMGEQLTGAHETIMDSNSKPLMTVSKPRRGEGVSITLILDGKGDREEAQAALLRLLDQFWPVLWTPEGVNAAAVFKNFTRALAKALSGAMIDDVCKGLNRQVHGRAQLTRRRFSDLFL